MNKLGEKVQFTTMGRLVSIAPVLYRGKDGVHIMSFVSCIRCVSDNQRKDISDTILKGRMNKEKWVKKNGNDVCLISSQYPISKNTMNEMMDNVMREMKEDLNMFVKFNPALKEPGNISTSITSSPSFVG